MGEFRNGLQGLTTPVTLEAPQMVRSLIRGRPGLEFGLQIPQVQGAFRGEFNKFCLVMEAPGRSFE